MSPEQKKLLEQAGVNYTSGLERFMNNEAMFQRFLKKFAQDDSYNQLCNALSTGDCEAAFRAAHTLKGVAGNLSMDTLFHALTSQTEQLRSGDLESARAAQPQIDTVYHAILDALSALS